MIYKRNSQLTPNLQKNLKKWIEAKYSPCKVEILPNIYQDVLDRIPLRDLGTQKNCHGEKQYNAIGILNQVIGPIQRARSNAIGVLSFTDVDLFTKQLSNYCFGYGIPSQGGVQSVHRFTKKFTYEKYKTPEEEENAMLMRVCKIATHELAHMFGLGHCAWYECLQKGTNHLEQTDRHPPYFCPVCYRKLHKCVKWDHVKRYKALMELCDEFGG